MSLLGENPCQNSNEIKELSSGDRTIIYDSSTDKCDSDIGNDWSKWYKITGKAGNALRVATPPRERCGGRAQGYLKKDHPVPSDGVVNRQVCIQNPSNSCRREIQIRVVNCGLFYLYQLQRLRSDCNLNWRYCTNGKGKHLPSVIIIIITIMNIIMALKLLLMIKLKPAVQDFKTPLLQNISTFLIARTLPYLSIVGIEYNVLQIGIPNKRKKSQRFLQYITV